MMDRVDKTLLTPLLLLERAATALPGRCAISHGERQLSYKEMAAEATRLAHALQASGIQPGERVAYLCPNTPEMLIAHFGAPLAHAVLVAINTRLSWHEVEYILNHSGARVLFVDTGLMGTVAPFHDRLETVEEIVAIDDAGIAPAFECTAYAAFMARGSDEPLPWRVDDEDRIVSINYTSGTTGRPKGVMYSHRGAYLNALGETIHSRHTVDTVYLWTLPMFHCNGWCTTWAVTGIGGTHVCLRAVEPGEVWRLIRAEGVTHLNAAPTVLIMLANHPDAAPVEKTLTVTTAGAPPSPTLIGQLERLNMQVVHFYGLTETYGPFTVCEWQHEWNGVDGMGRARLLARQGVSFAVSDPIRVVDEGMNDVPRDGQTLGEVVMQGNIVMAGYYNDPEATAEAFRGGWFHSGDIGVWHPDGYIDLRDRKKDVIISGGENISTIEVEQAIASHPAVLECAVVSMPHETWGERPKAFVIRKDGQTAGERELIEHVREQLAHFKAPDAVEFVAELPKTATGKIQKFVLREREWAGYEARIYGGAGREG
jgi:fatty-acyl-CoA synthase